MIKYTRAVSSLILCMSVTLCVQSARSAEPEKTPAANYDITTGLRVFTCGHSFHATVIPKLLNEIALSAGLKNHTQIGVSMIGGSRAIQHWDVPDAKNAAKTALKEGKVDVLTLSCMTEPDEGIANFATFAFEHNPNIRITLQELWVPEDHFPFSTKNRVHKTPADFDVTTIEDLKKTNEAYQKVMEDYVNALNTKLGKQVVFIAPDVQAAFLLREKIHAGAAPGLTKASELFTDEWGHPSMPLRLLASYVHFSVIYRRSPVGLPIPAGAAGAKGVAVSEPLNHLLQELAWDAVSHHPMSGVKGEK